jgi:predicted nuclease of predicted toxin-antitoxin system
MRQRHLQCLTPSLLVDALRFFADENIPRGIVIALRDTGHDVVWGCEVDVGASDLARLLVAHSDNRFILTEDIDFINLIAVEGVPVRGIHHVKLDGLGRDRKIARVCQAIIELGVVAEGTINVIEHARVRTHKSSTLPGPTKRSLT